MMTSSGSIVRSASSSAWRGSPSLTSPRAASPAAASAATEVSSRCSAASRLRSESESSQWLSRELASVGATTSTSAPPDPARYCTSSTTVLLAQVSLAITRIRRGRVGGGMEPS